MNLFDIATYCKWPGMSLSTMLRAVRHVYRDYGGVLSRRVRDSRSRSAYAGCRTLRSTRRPRDDNRSGWSMSGCRSARSSTWRRSFRRARCPSRRPVRPIDRITPSRRLGGLPRPLPRHPGPARPLPRPQDRPSRRRPPPRGVDLAHGHQGRTIRAGRRRLSSGLPGSEGPLLNCATGHPSLTT